MVVLLDLDLLLIKYYKKRLEPQLKKKEIYITDHTLIKLTKLTGLQLPTNWASFKNLSPENLFPLTPLTSLLSLLSLVNFFACLVPYHKPFCCHFYPKCSISSCHFVVIPLFVYTMKQFLKQKVEEEIIPIGCYSSMVFLKDPSFISIPMYFQAIMPYSVSPEAFFFEGSNITNFFDSYNLMCTNY